MPPPTAETGYREASAHGTRLPKSWADYNARFGVKPERIHVVPGGVEADRFAIAESRADCRLALGWPLDRPIVLCVRRLVRRVGVDTLVEAAVAIRKRVPDALVLIAGTGPLRSELEARIATLGVSDTVRLLGFVPDVDLPRAYRAADLSVVPTMSLEGFGLITVESLAAGTPCLVTPIGGMRDIVTPLAPQLVMDSTRGEDIASEAVKNHIKLICERENPKGPYSDQKIVELLKAQGIEIARRTVAKYREVLGILPSSKRKRWE